VQPPVWLWARGCLSRPQVGLPKFLGAIEDRGLHEPQRRREIVFQTPDKCDRHWVSVQRSERAGTSRSEKPDPAWAEPVGDFFRIELILRIAFGVPDGDREEGWG